ncbi:hypothetical protein AAFC00_000976 [Neodothiora populina]|uniref:OPA3-like protein n=1 Tax=Neodothiora populina TaxID=2781224 RepID=A0ABR3PMN3_9PEZI
MSLTLKLASLVVRTLAKPVGNTIKRNAREHDGFRRYCVTFAQGLHRIDMRMRLGILHDAAAQERMHAREAAEAAAKKKAAGTPTVKTEAQIKAEEAAATEAEKTKASDKPKTPYKPKIRPLSEARAIELGANFIAESFVFLVALGCILAERMYSGRKESTRRDEVAERLEALEARAEKMNYLEAEISRLRAANETEAAPKAVSVGDQKPLLEISQKKEPKETKDTEEKVEGSVPTK